MTSDISTDQAKIGIIGGSGLYDMDGLEEPREVSVSTPYGPPSEAVMLGRIEGIPVAFLARHGKNHHLLPSEINYRANIFAMKKLGVERILSVSAVGSMKKEIVPTHIVIPDQFYDLTKGRKNTFFGDGIVAHVSLANPICPDLAALLAKSGEALGATIHRGGTYLCMEGPQFSTRAESEIHRTWGVDVIGMTNATEAKLAREAEICYVTIALSTDYDCWYVEEGHVTVDIILKILRENVAFSKKLLRAALREISEGKLGTTRTCYCANALKNAIITPPPSNTREDERETGTDCGKISEMKNLTLIIVLLLSGCIDHFTVPSKEALQHPFPPLKQSLKISHAPSGFLVEDLENDGIAIIGILKGGPDTLRQNAAFELFQGLRSFFPKVQVIPRKELIQKIRAAGKLSDYRAFLKDYETRHFMDLEKLKDWGQFTGVRYLFIGQVTINDKHTATRTMVLAEYSVGGKISASSSGPAHIPYDVEKKVTIRGEVWDSQCGQAIWIGTSHASVKEQMGRERVRVEDIFTMATRKLIGGFDAAIKKNSGKQKSVVC